MKNNSLREIAQKIREAKSILLFPHVNLDGDALGSCVALCKALRSLKKEAWILLEDDIPANLRFLDKGYCTWEKEKVLHCYLWKWKYENPSIYGNAIIFTV